VRLHPPPLQENHIAINTINPLKAYRDGDLKEIANLKKRCPTHLSCFEVD
jgi:hypothetical protein